MLSILVAIGHSTLSRAKAATSTTPLAGRLLIELLNGALASVLRKGNEQAAPASTLVLLHGAGLSPHDMIDRFAREPASADDVLVAPASCGVTWDIIAMAAQRALENSALDSDTFHYGSSFLKRFCNAEFYAPWLIELSQMRGQEKFQTQPSLAAQHKIAHYAR